MLENEPEFLAIFRDEADELLEAMVAVLLACERGLTDQSESIDLLFRHAHTLKGSAGILAEALKDFVNAAGKGNDVIILDPTAPPGKEKAPTKEPRYRVKPEEPPSTQPMPPPTAPNPQRKSLRLAPPKTGDRYYTTFTKAQISDPQAQKKDKEKPAPETQPAKAPPVIFGVAGFGGT